ncbi:MAG: DUF819 family protein [Gemmatimonadetes bacterium]|nr:DUF819 family protein [Gemmatimonadota bacterium]
MLTNSLFILAVLCLNVVLSEWLVRRTFCRHFGTALLVIIVTAVASNAGLIPASGTPVPVYDVVFTYLAPVGIFWLLLRVNLRDILRAGLPVLVMFLIGSVGTVVGVVVAMWAVGGAESIGASYRHVGAMFVGTYVGGSVNFNALAFHYGVAKDGALYTTSMVADNIATAVWMVATIALPRALMGVWPRRRAAVLQTPAPEVAINAEDDSETMDPLSLAPMLAAWFMDQVLGRGGFQSHSLKTWIPHLPTVESRDGIDTHAEQTVGSSLEEGEDIGMDLGTLKEKITITHSGQPLLLFPR